MVAHELGHAKDNDVLTGTLIGALGAAAGGDRAVPARLVGLAAAAGRRRRRSASRARSACCSPWPRWPGWSPAPAQAFVSRRIEARADAHALALTGDPATFEAMQRRLGTVNLADPDPPTWEYVLFASHPSTVERMAAARAYARGRALMGRTLLVTNDFPPRPGGIQQFVHNLAVRQPAGSLVVYASTWSGADEVRRRAAVRGGPRGHRRAAARPRRSPGGRPRSPGRTAATRVWFGAAAPLGLLAGRLRRTRRHPPRGRR